MEFFISYCVEYNRVLSGIILENRQGIPAIKDKSGFQALAYVDEQIAAVTDTVIPYIIETAAGNLAAYFSLQVTNGVAVLLQYYARPNFAQFETEISLKLSTFIESNDWNTDIL